MTAIAINPMIVSVSPIAETSTKQFAPTEHGGGVKKVVAVVAAVAIPFAAPIIASSIGLSAAIGAATSAVVGNVIGSAIVGAGLGAISAKVTGGNVKTSAIMGAIGGGISGYFSTPSTTASTTTPAGATTDGGLMQASADGTVGLNTTGADPSLAAATDGGATLTNAVYQPAGGDVAATLSNTGTQVGADAAAQASLGERFMTTVADAGSKVVDKLTSADALANLTLQAGGQLLGQALAGDPDMSPEQKELLEMRKTELAELKQRDEAAFTAQMDAAKAFMQQSQQYDPQYFAMQAANKEAIESQRKIREQARRAGLSTGRGISAAEQRRMQLDASRNVSSRYDQGYRQGMTLQDAALKNAASTIPSGAQSSAYNTALSGMYTAYSDLNTQKQQQAKNISDLFAGFNTKSGNTASQTAELEGLSGGITGDDPKKKKNAGLDTSGLLMA